MSTQESRKKFVKETSRKIYELLLDIGAEIEKTTSEGEANNLIRIVMFELDNHIANEIWEYYVDWDKVVWRNE